MKNVLLLLVLAVMMAGCAGTGFDIFSSGALSSCGKCVADLMEEKTEADNQTAVEEILKEYGVKVE